MTIENRDLLDRLNTVAHAFLLAVIAATPGHTLGEGEPIVVFDVGDPATLGLVVNRAPVATALLDGELGPLVAEIVQRGLDSLKPLARALAGAMVAEGKARVCLFVRIGESPVTVTGRLVETGGVRSEALFALTTAAPTVN